MDNKTDGFRYAAFISYRHLANDRKWAKWLHATLERYRFPRIVQRTHRLPARLGRVFRDEEELAASAQLGPEIEEALSQSKSLIVVCSLTTPQSQWVEAEISFFRRLGRGRHILALLVDGEPKDAFPRGLAESNESSDDRTAAGVLPLSSFEPLAADVRPMDGESTGSRRRHASLKITAGMVGLPFDELRRRDDERRVRRWVFVGAATAVGFAVMLGLALWANSERIRAEDLAKESRARQLAAESLLYRERDPERSQLLAIEAFESKAIAPSEDELRIAFEQAAPLLVALRGHTGDILAATFSPDGKTIATASDDHTVKMWSAQTGELLATLAGHTDGVSFVQFSQDGKQLITSSLDNTARVWSVEPPHLLRTIDESSRWPGPWPSVRTVDAWRRRLMRGRSSCGQRTPPNGSRWRDIVAPSTQQTSARMAISL